jgi:hypothetical protein
MNYAEVCNICGDTLISREVTDKIFELVKMLNLRRVYHS